MPVQTVTINIAGANHQTQQVQVNVDPSTGVGSATFTYTGTNGGTDTISATTVIDGSTKSSNSAQVNWQQSNGSIQIPVDSVTAYWWNDSNHSNNIVSYPKFNANDPAAAALGLVAQPPTSSPNGLAIITPVNTASGSAGPGNSFTIDYPTLGNGNTAQWSASTDSAGNPTFTTPLTGTSTNFNVVLAGKIYVPDTNLHTVSFVSKDYVNIGIGGVSISTPATGSVGQTMSALYGYPLVAASPYTGSDATSTGSGTFRAPAPGVYSVEANWDYWYHSGRTLQILFDGAFPTLGQIMSAPPASTPSGNFTITPAGGNSNLLPQGQQITLTIQLTGLTYTSSPYLPLLEGTAGQVYITNETSGLAYDFPALPGGATVDRTTALSLLSVSGNNASWQNRLSISASGNDYLLNYGGQSADPSVASTDVTVSVQDVAWYNSNAKTIDAFGITSQGGGSQATVHVDWLVMPSIASVTPNSIPGDGQQHTVTVSLAKPLPPIQNNIQATFSIGGGVLTLNSTIMNTDSNGFITGWTLFVTAPVGSAVSNAPLSLSASAPLTYLSGDAVVTQTVTYFNNQQIATI